MSEAIAQMADLSRTGTAVPLDRGSSLRDENTAKLGMWIFLGSWAMLFAGLFFTYGAIREATARWPPAGLPRLPLGLPALNTLALLASSALLQLGLSRTRRGERAALAVFGAFSLGLIFLSLQLVVWTQVWKSGMTVTGGPYPSVFYGLTAFHALHVLVGLAALFVLWIGCASGRIGAARHLALSLWTLYWHFVGAVWLIIFASVYLA